MNIIVIPPILSKSQVDKLTRDMTGIRADLKYSKETVVRIVNGQRIYNL